MFSKFKLSFIIAELASPRLQQLHCQSLLCREPFYPRPSNLSPLYLKLMLMLLEFNFVFSQSFSSPLLVVVAHFKDLTTLKQNQWYFSTRDMLCDLPYLQLHRAFIKIDSQRSLHAQPHTTFRHQ